MRRSYLRFRISHLLIGVLLVAVLLHWANQHAYTNARIVISDVKPFCADRYWFSFKVVEGTEVNEVEGLSIVEYGRFHYLDLQIESKDELVNLPAEFPFRYRKRRLLWLRKQDPFELLMKKLPSVYLYHRSAKDARIDSIRIEHNLD